MKKLLAAAGAALLLSMAGTASAYTVHYGHQLESNNNNFTTPYSNTLIETFDSGAPQFGWSGDFQIINSSIPNVAAAPNGLSTYDTTYFLSTPAVLGGGDDYVTTANLGGPFNYLGLWWGSVDSYNSIKFFLNGTEGITISGSDAISPSSANGNQTAPSTNLYVNFLDLPEFDQFQLISTQYAFEADNIAVALNPVPEPGTMMLLGAGFLGLAIYGKRRKNS